MSTSIRLETIDWSPDSWPRSAADPERVTEFAELYMADGPDALPAIEVLQIEEGYLLAEGHHRLAAAAQAGLPELPAIVRPTGGRDPVELAFEIGLAAAATAAKPLTRAEKRNAIRKLLRAGGRTDREVGRLVGVAHTTVARTRLADQASGADAGTDEMPIDPSADELARRLAAGLRSLWERRGLSDLLIADRMGGRLAAALEDGFGDEALAWARRLERWAVDARRQLAKGPG